MLEEILSNQINSQIYIDDKLYDEMSGPNNVSHHIFEQNFLEGGFH